MKVEITYSPSTEHYTWKLWTGPDGIDYYEGVAISLGECFEELIKYEILNSIHYFDETKDEKDNTPNLQKIIDKMVEERKSQKLWNRVRDELGYSIDLTDEIVDLVEDWLPKEQSAAGSQNVDTELLVDGFNDCVRRMKEMLR